MDQKISHHLLLCAMSTTGACCDYSLGLETWKRLKGIVKELGLEDSGRPEGIVLRSKVDCLRICKEGPILLIWPEGIWYKKVTPKRVERIVYEHVLRGKPCRDWIIRTTPQAFI